MSKPGGETKEDPNFGTVQVYHDSVTVDVAAGNARSLKVTWQGCADEGLCYPPIRKSVTVTLASATDVSGDASGAAATSATTATIVNPASHDRR